MKIIIKKKTSIEDVLNAIASNVDDKYHYIPGWFEKDEDGNFDFHHIEKLPNELKTKVKNLRK